MVSNPRTLTDTADLRVESQLQFCLVELDVSGGFSDKQLKQRGMLAILVSK